MSLDVDVVLDRGDFVLRAAFSASTGVTALFGPSGAGKSTLAAIVAGLARPTSGRVVLDGTTLVDISTGLFMPPHRRRIAAVFQDGRLFPHLTVRQNLLYGAWFNRTDRTRLEPTVELLGIGPLLNRWPTTLSGGEQRRVAIGRALLAAPHLLVLDEPLTGLDAARKEEILPYLEQLRDQQRVPMIYVSHALDEIVRLADTMVLLEHGKLVAAGTIEDVMPLLALGSHGAEAGSILETQAISVDTTHELATLAFAGGTLTVPAADIRVGDRLRVHIRAREVAIATEKPQGLSMLNILAARVIGITEAGSGAVDVTLDAGGARLLAQITRLSAENLALAPGRPVHALIKSVAFARSGQISS